MKLHEIFPEIVNGDRSTEAFRLANTEVLLKLENKGVAKWPGKQKRLVDFVLVLEGGYLVTLNMNPRGWTYPVLYRPGTTKYLLETFGEKP